jgi:hypothetical protein
MSSNGRFIAFDSIATNLVPGDGFPACGFEDIFVRDTCFGVASGCNPSTVRVSVTNTPNPGTQANGLSGYPAISGDGHYAVFLLPPQTWFPAAPTATKWYFSPRQVSELGLYSFICHVTFASILSRLYN